MSRYLRRTPALKALLVALQEAQPAAWGLQLARLSNRPTGTVYPLLERLESQGMVVSSWETDTSRTGPRRRLYSFTPAGWAWAHEQLSEPRPAVGSESVAANEAGKASRDGLVGRRATVLRLGLLT